MLGALRTRDEDRGDEGREGAETREELLGAKRGDGRTDGADGTEGEDSDTDSAGRGVELPEGAPPGTVPWVAARRLKRRQRSSEPDRLPPSGRAADGRGGFAGSLGLRLTLFRPRTVAEFGGARRLRRLVVPAVDLVAVVRWGLKPGAERPASDLTEERALVGRVAWVSLPPMESTYRTISWRCWTKERRLTLRLARSVE